MRRAEVAHGVIEAARVTEDRRGARRVGTSDRGKGEPSWRLGGHCSVVVVAVACAKRACRLPPGFAP